MRFAKLGTLVIGMLVFAGVSFAQKRAPQWEVFIGGAIPTEPEGIEDEVNMGLSFHGQYVLFPFSPRFGVSLDVAFETFTSGDDLDQLVQLGLNVDVEGELNMAKSASVCAPISRRRNLTCRYLFSAWARLVSCNL